MLNVPSPALYAKSLLSPFFTSAFPTVSPIWFAASNSFPASSYAFCFVITEVLLSSIPSALVSSIVVMDFVPTEIVALLRAAIASVLAYAGVALSLSATDGCSA